MHGHGVDLSPKKSRFADIAEVVIKWIKANRTSFLTLIGFIFAAIIAVIVIFNVLAKNKQDASDNLSYAYNLFAAGKSNEGYAQLNTIIDGYKNTPAAYEARLIQADILIDQKYYDQALLLLNETIAKGKPAAVRPLALVRVIYLYDRQKDYNNAILYSTEFIKKYKTHFMVKNIYLNLAEYYLLQGATEDAVNVYNDILINYPASNEAYAAEAKLKEMKK
ncbi:tetratricopeptide repeat protein [Endomicrobium proavitum]|uniref:Ancillary SecYEG translocon subunit/Cell division coordinator CpoB TPR domain-containing protein n=1 Tax=Endomicrobium proavitum TaxID=1408281 RepID=A0A0G3WJ36_9BACT|nr:tetratricopeptide repeat protein [Endomicrobium proavitum]AKL97897.1 hypothetical protein Epro_0518 [Endomicrobium proavitum]